MVQWRPTKYATGSERYKLQIWFSVNKLSLNIAKKKYMSFSGRARGPDIDIRKNIYTDKNSTC